MSESSFASSGAASQPAKKVVLRNGIAEKSVESGMTVKQYREQYGEFLSIPKDAKAFSGNRELSDDEVVSDAGVLEFVRKSGEKG